MYASEPDPDCYPGTQVLRNLLGLRDQNALDAYELEMYLQRASEGVPAGRLSLRHYLAIHHHLFQDVYPWAGRCRGIRIAKGGNSFCYPEHIRRELTALFRKLRSDHFLRGLGRAAFATAAAHFLSELNAIHAFRE